jgi:subtilisin family serine protease
VVVLSSQNPHRSWRISLCLVAVFLIADLGVLANNSPLEEGFEPGASLMEQPILIDGLPPLMCGDELCLRPIRDIDRGERISAEAEQWWQSYGPDLDWNGMDDRLQRVLSGQESVSPTAILGDDGRKTVAIVVDYAWRANAGEIETLRAILDAHGWVGEEGGAWFQQLDDIDSIAVDKVPVSALMDIYSSHGVVVIEMQNVMIPFNDIAAKASRSRPSDIYSATAYERDYIGEDIVIAVLDTGVDNEHESLNDFDDVADEPDEDPLSYNDHKWVGGYDATSSAGSTQGDQDPDDGNGHGTHVAGSALGTGDSSRVHMGTAPGAYLVDIKVLTDTGGTNSQASLNGIQWLIDNQNKDWGHNSSSRGIQIASMSFGSASTPLNDGDQGDNGSGAEARLVNDAVNASIVCVIAMGNDGSNRVPSPASADDAISIGSASDRGTINRTTDVVADYSNTGPRISDSDDDEWDELKPDITAFGSDIMSATAQTGSSFPGQPSRPLAGSDYDEKSGTSMATPIASGIIATMLQANPSLEPQEVKDILRNSSEQRGSASEPSVSQRWNDEWGFGLIDASCAIDMALEKACTPLEDNGGIINQPPTGNGTGDYVDMSKPNNGSWWIEGDFVRVAGGVSANQDGDDFTKVQVKIEQYLESGTVRELQNWADAGGDVSSWFLDISVKESWIRQDEDYVLVLARALTDDGDESAVDARWVNLARMAVTIAGPALGTALQGTVEFSGTVEGIEHDRLEYRIGTGDWILGEQLDAMEVGTQDWSFTWNSNSVEDGSHRISVQMVNESGVKTDDVRRTYTVDNQPAAPDFLFQGSVEIMDQGLPVYSAVAGTVLEVDFTITNAGDLDANEVLVQLNAPGSQSNTYPRETRISTLQEGGSQQITLYWWATEAGTHDVSIVIDPNNQHSDPNTANNEYTFSFEVEERPVESMLRFLPGAVTTNPKIPLPDTPYQITVRLDNLGKTDATLLQMRLERWGEIGWMEIAIDDLLVVPGSDSSSGSSNAVFSDTGSSIGPVDYRVLLEGNGVEIEHSEHRFTIVVDDASIGSPVSVSLSSGEVAIELVGLEDGALLFTTRDGELHVRTFTSSMVMQVDEMLEEKWGGELATYLRDDGLVQAAWSRKTISPDGYTLSDLSMTSLTRSAVKTPVHHQMPAIKLSEGSYWGLDLTQHDGVMVLAGYHRDISTGGSWQDITSIFTLTSTTPDSPASWSSPNIVVSDIDIRPSQGDALSIVLGQENLHILYQEIRDDVTGIDRVGLMYTHGDSQLSAWGFQSSVGDNARNAEIAVLGNGSDDVLVAAWIEGRGKEAKIAHIVTDNGWSDDAELLSSPGITFVELNPTSDGIQILYDEINTNGPVTRYGLLSDSENGNTLSLSNIVAEGFLLGYAGLEYDGIVLLSSASGALKMRTLADVNSLQKIGEPSPSFIEKLLAPIPGDDQTKTLILGGVSIGFIVFLAAIVVSVRSSRRQHSQDKKLYVETVEVESDGLELLIQPLDDDGPLVAIDSDADDLIVGSVAPVAVIEDEEDQTLSQSLEAKSTAGEGNARLNRRMKRKQEREFSEITESLSNSLPPLPLPLPAVETPGLAKAIVPLPALEGLPPLPALPGLPGLPGLPPLPAIAPPQRDVVCSECNAKFTVKDMTLRAVACPICSANVDF